MSGTQRRRPQLDALMKNAGKRRFDVVLVWKFDRFARSVKHLVESLDEFKAPGIDFVSYTEGVDTTTPTGQLSANSRFLKYPDDCEPDHRHSDVLRTQSGPIRGMAIS